MTSNMMANRIISGFFGFSVGFLSLWLTFRWNRRQEKKLELDSPATPIQLDELLHWDRLAKRRGLCDLVVKVSHIAITVSDVGKALDFYVNILGLQQIRRPNFDRHGAWLTLGNIELHLIKGIPAIPLVDNLQTAHIALETTDINEVLSKLHELNIDVRQNISVTNATASMPKLKSSIIQYFFNDPDGYYWEICNCDVLTEFAFAKDLIMDHIDYHEGIPNDRKLDATRAVSYWKDKVEKRRTEQLDDILDKISQADQIDEEKFQNLHKRRAIYGDIVQGFTDEDIKELLLKTNNSVPLTIEILTQKRGENKFYQPPAFIENGRLVKPESFIMNQHDFK
jgi:catechol 2,3-dioxygenase-like lactoylglutathione lyase family enzyme